MHKVSDKVKEKVCAKIDCQYCYKTRKDDEMYAKVGKILNKSPKEIARITAEYKELCRLCREQNTDFDQFLLDLAKTVAETCKDDDIENFIALREAGEEESYEQHIKVFEKLLEKS